MVPNRNSTCRKWCYYRITAGRNGNFVNESDMPNGYGYFVKVALNIICTAILVTPIWNMLKEEFNYTVQHCWFDK